MRDLGVQAEAVVVQFLKDGGYTVVATNLRLGALEIDIVARKGRTVAVVEVRYRSSRSWTRPLSSIDFRKRERLRRAGERLWRARYRHDQSVDRLRFDAASVQLEDVPPTVNYVVAAF